MGNKRANPDRRIAWIATHQHGVVTSAQLRAEGFSRPTISKRVRAGRLHSVHRGVYAVGHPRLTFEGRCLAAVLACQVPRANDRGPVTLLSHRSAAALWRVLPAHGGPIAVSVPGAAGRRTRRGITIHRSVTLSTRTVTRRLGIPVTTPARTLRDLRRGASPGVLQKAVRRALDLRLVGPDALGPDPDLTRSELERMFLRLCRRRRLPQPEVNARIGSFEVDFLWRSARLIVETDGFRHHGSRAAFETDRVRDAKLQALGYRVLRFTYRQVHDAPDSVAATLREVLGGVGEQRRLRPDL